MFSFALLNITARFSRGLPVFSVASHSLASFTSKLAQPPQFSLSALCD